MPEITDDPPPLALAAVVRAHVIAVCERCGWNLKQAARVLGIAENLLQPPESL
jgi:transcriptional regulator of acetoin/glycerol metabolism